MELSPFALYLIGMADMLRGGLIGLAILTSIGFAISFVFLLCGLSDDDTPEQYIRQFAKWVHRFGLAVLLICISLMFIPNSKTLATMYGVEIIEEVSQQ